MDMINIILNKKDEITNKINNMSLLKEFFFIIFILFYFNGFFIKLLLLSSLFMYWVLDILVELEMNGKNFVSYFMETNDNILIDKSQYFCDCIKACSECNFINYSSLNFYIICKWFALPFELIWKYSEKYNVPQYVDKLNKQLIENICLIFNYINNLETIKQLKIKIKQKIMSLILENIFSPNNSNNTNNTNTTNNRKID